MRRTRAYMHPHMRDIGKDTDDGRCEDRVGLFILIGHALGVRRVDKTSDGRRIVLWHREPCEEQRALAAALLDAPCLHSV